MDNYTDKLLLAKYDSTPVNNTYIKKIMTDNNNILFDSKDSRINNLIISNGVLKNIIETNNISDNITMQDINGDSISFKLSNRDQLTTDQLTNNESNLQQPEQLIYNSTYQDDANNSFSKNTR